MRHTLDHSEPLNSAIAAPIPASAQVQSFNCPSSRNSANACSARRQAASIRPRPVRGLGCVQGGPANQAERRRVPRGTRRIHPAWLARRLPSSDTAGSASSGIRVASRGELSRARPGGLERGGSIRFEDSSASEMPNLREAGNRHRCRKGRTPLLDAGRWRTTAGRGVLVLPGVRGARKGMRQ